MKKLAILASCFVAVAAMAQGTVNFANGAAGVNAPISDPAGARLNGTAYVAQLWAGSSATSLAPVGAVVAFRTGTGAGYFLGGERVIPGVAAGGTAFVQVRAWSAAGGTTWESAAANPTAQVGWSGGVWNPTAAASPFQVTVGGGTLPPGNLVGLTSFNLVNVPEPATLALGVLGGLALLIRRRK